jgi:hypothetical protein
VDVNTILKLIENNKISYKYDVIYGAKYIEGYNQALNDLQKEVINKENESSSN